MNEIRLKQFSGECLAGIAHGVGIDDGYELGKFGIAGSGGNRQSHRILKGAAFQIFAGPVEPVGIRGQFWKPLIELFL